MKYQLVKSKNYTRNQLFYCYTLLKNENQFIELNTFNGVNFESFNYSVSGYFTWSNYEKADHYSIDIIFIRC
jgi:hypothetical protein